MTVPEVCSHIRLNAIARLGSGGNFLRLTEKLRLQFFVWFWLGPFCFVLLLVFTSPSSHLFSRSYVIFFINSLLLPSCRPMSLNLHVCFLEHVTTAGLFLKAVRKHLQYLVCEMSGAGVQTRATNRMFISCLLPAAGTGLQTLEDCPVRTQAHTVTAAAAVRGSRGINPGSQLYKHRFKGHTTTG